jgi:hypothetical protein
MHGHSRILLAEATRLMASTRRRIDLTLQVLEKPAPGVVRRRSLVVVSAGGVEPLEQGKDQIRPAGLALGVDGEPEPRR